MKTFKDFLEAKPAKMACGCDFVPPKDAFNKKHPDIRSREAPISFCKKCVQKKFPKGLL